MTISTAKLNSRFQLTIPADLRRQLGLRAGDTVVLEVTGDRMTLRPMRAGQTEASSGLGADLWREVGGAAAIEAERDGWD